jgi:hypothetical protein
MLQIMNESDFQHNSSPVSWLPGGGFLIENGIRIIVLLHTRRILSKIPCILLIRAGVNGVLVRHGARVGTVKGCFSGFS